MLRFEKYLTGVEGRMEALWVIAISTAISAFVFLAIAVFLIEMLVTLKKRVNQLSESVDHKMQSLDSTWRAVLGLAPKESKDLAKEPPRKLPWILRGIVFATAFWKHMQKRR